MPDATTFAYLAGMIDGDGYISITRSVRAGREYFGAHFRNRNAMIPGLIAQAACSEYETRLRLAVDSLRDGWMDESQFNDLADTMDMLQIGMASYSKQKPDPSTEVAIEICREALMSVRNRYLARQRDRRRILRAEQRDAAKTQEKEAA